MFGKGLSRKKAKAIYQILVEECGAPEHSRLNFVMAQSSDEVTEWRFCGRLGFGGKFWRNSGRMYVNCYREDENPEILAMIEAANKRLEAL